MSTQYESDPATHSGTAKGGDGYAHDMGGHTSKTRERLNDFANRQKDAGAEQLSGFAQAAHKAADSLDEQNAGFAGLVHEAADGLDRLSGNLREQDVSQLYGSMNRFARRQPLAFLAGSFAAGLVLARFMKSSAPTGGDHEQQPYHPSPNL